MRYGACSESVVVPTGKLVAVGYRLWEKSIPVKSLPVAFPHLRHLKLVRLPIPPPPQVYGAFEFTTGSPSLISCIPPEYILVQDRRLQSEIRGMPSYN